MQNSRSHEPVRLGTRGHLEAKSPGFARAHLLTSARDTQQRAICLSRAGRVERRMCGCNTKVEANEASGIGQAARKVGDILSRVESAALLSCIAVHQDDILRGTRMSFCTGDWLPLTPPRRPLQIWTTSSPRPRHAFFPCARPTRLRYRQMATMQT